MEKIGTGIWKLTLGTPEAITPVKLRISEPALDRLAGLPEAPAPPFTETDIRGERTAHGYVITLPLAEGELVYGLGLQLLSFEQRDKKKVLRVNADPTADLGDSHAPVPFYVTNAGYGVLVDTARYMAFYCGGIRRRRGDGFDLEPPSIVLEIPCADGADVYLFAGPTMREVVQRYNLFSGGGSLPPRWGLGVWYRPNINQNQEQAGVLTRAMREDRMPCDVYGLEQGWHRHYSPSSYTWDMAFPEPRKLTEDLTSQNYRLNLWIGPFIHPDAPVAKPLLPYSGDYIGRDGIAPDFTMPEARRILSDFLADEHVARGVSGFKLDECDNSDWIAYSWSFPEHSQFPSGADGEQMHSLLGIHYSHAVYEPFRRLGRRTWNQTRNSHALAASLPFVLFSDLYDHSMYIRGIPASGFSGLLWCPEVRIALSDEDFVRRLQTTACSALTCIDGWFLQSPPWLQWDGAKNCAGELADNRQELTDRCRSILELRMQLIPYLQAAFLRYWKEGLPPFRALIMDWPDDPQLKGVDMQYMMGDRLMVAPMIEGQAQRDVYLPQGNWRCFWTGTLTEGGQTITVRHALDTFPLFVKDGSILPLAKPTLHTGDPASFELTVRVYGNGDLPIALFEDDDCSYAFEEEVFNTLELAWNEVSQSVQSTRVGTHACPAYRVVAEERIP